MSPIRRGAVVAGVLLLLVGGGLIDRRSRPDTRLATVPPVPMAAAANARSSAWYCTGATAAKDGVADGTVVLANAGQRPLQGTVTVFPAAGDPKPTSVTVGSQGRQTLHLADVVSAPYVSALVELDGGDVVVELSVTGALGESVTPCASSASSQWYFADGVTTKDAAEVLLLFNPFPDDAVVDLAFGTEEGQVTPEALSGLAVRGGGMVAVDVGAHVQRRQQVTAAVRARAGRLVAARLQSFDGTAGRKGMALTLGTAATGDLWYLPDGQVADGVTERYQIYNPSTKEASVAVDLSLEQGEAEPIEVTVPAESRITITANDEARIPKVVPHAATVRSTNGVGIVVERGIDAVAPSKRTGITRTPGAGVAARRWCLAAGAADDSTEELVVVQNPGPASTRVSISVLAGGQPVAGEGLQDVELAPGQRRAFRLNGAVPPGATPVVVDADRPVVVERALGRLKSTGLASSIGIPLRDGARRE